MDVFLTRDLESWIRDSVDLGTYNTEGHLVRRALRMLREHHESQEGCPSREHGPPRREAPELRVVPAK